MATNYPNWAAGDPISASMLNYTQGDVIVKTVATDRASTSTLADDPDLTTTLDANATYLIEFGLHMVSPITSAPVSVLIKTQWTVPSGATGNRWAIGIGSTQNESNANNVSGRFGVHGFATAVVYGSRGNSTSQIGALESAIVTTTSSGTCAIQWAQNTSNAQASSMSAGSYMKIKRVA